MTTRPKQIVLDKSAFDGINLKTLCEFTARYFLIVSDTLLYECGTTTEQSQRPKKLSACASLIEAGAYCCECSIDYVQWEGVHLQPYPRLLADLDKTKDVQERRVDLRRELDVSAVDSVFVSRCEVAKKMLIERSVELKKKLDSEHIGVGDVIGEEMPTNRQERLRMWLEKIDPRGMFQRGVYLFPKDWIEDKTRFGLSDEWMSWHFTRLAFALAEDYYYLRQKGGSPGNTRAEHDWQDMEYVLLLSRADAILTKDRGLIELARAAFPDKDVFSNLEDVPESYRCDWVGL